MKIIILFVFLSFYVSGLAGDLDRYINAYKTIKDSSSVVQKCFSEYYKSRTDTFQICLSDRIYYMSKISFISQIIEYEYGNPQPYGTLWRQIRDSLTKLEFEKESNQGSFDNYRELPDLNKICTSSFCDLKLFFGDIDENNRLQASLIFNNGRENFINAYNQSQCGLNYLFYFKGDEVTKVIIYQFVR